MMTPARESWSDCLACGNSQHPGMDAESRVKAYQVAIDLFVDRVERATAEDTRAGQILINDTRRVQNLRHRSTKLELVK